MPQTLIELASQTLSQQLSESRSLVDDILDAPFPSDEYYRMFWNGIRNGTLTFAEFQELIRMSVKYGQEGGTLGRGE